MEISLDFFKDEVRHGFYIPTVVKQAWAAELSVLHEIDRVCKKHNIMYFADWGTLLGTVRHGGFIPWDDDLDICMKRADYKRFLEVAKKELPDGFDIYNFETKKDHWLFLARVVNRNRICFEEEHLRKYHNFPYIASVDIFVLDYLYKDENKEQLRRDKIMRLLTIAEEFITASASDDFKRANAFKLKEEYNVALPLAAGNEECVKTIYRLVERIMAEVPDNEADRVCQIFPFGLKGHKGFPKEYYDKSIDLPFENITIRVPSCYDRALRNKYGDYFEVRKVWTGHNYPFFEGQKKALEDVGATLTEFSYDKEKSTKIRDESTSLRIIVKTLLEETDKLLCDAITSDALATAQQNLLTLGNMLEESYGADASPAIDIVPFIETFFEKEYALYNDMSEALSTDKSLSEMNDAYVALKNAVNTHLLSRKEIYFLTNGVKEWETLAPIYNELKQDNTHELYVVYVPYFFKDPLGQLIITDEDIERALDVSAFPKELNVLNITQADLERRQPERIYIQSPYDETNPCLSVSPDYYATRLKNLTDELIYVPAHIVDDYTADDIIDVKNMRYYVCAPGVAYADKVMVSSPVLRDRYIEALSSFTKNLALDSNYWSGKITTYTYNAEVSEPSKKLLYCVGIEGINDNIDMFLNVLKKKIDIINQELGQASYDIAIYPNDENVWKQRLGSSYELFIDLLGPNLTRDIIMPQSYQAYYGAASPYVSLFSSVGKKALVRNADYEVESENIILLANDGVRIKDKIWCTGKNVALLFSIDINDGGVNIEGIAPNDILKMPQFTRRIHSWKDKIIMTPYNSKYIYLYDLTIGEWDYIAIPKPATPDSYYFESFIYDDKLYLIGAMVDNIVEIDLFTREQTVINEYFKSIGERHDIFSRNEYVILDNNVYIPLCVSNEVLKLNLKTREYKVLKIGDESNKFSGIAYDGEKFWLSARLNGDSIIWKTNGEIQILENPTSRLERKCYYGGVHVLEDNVIVYGLVGNTSLVYDFLGNLICVKDESFEFLNNQVGQLIDGNIIYGDKKILANISREKYNEQLALVAKKQGYFTNNRINNETSYFSLNMYLKAII